MFVIVTIVYAYPQSIPNHEADIIMMGLEEEVLYTLDSNGLLLINNLSNKKSDFRTPLRRPLFTAFFQYPYIIFVDRTYIMYVYDINNNFITYSSKFLNTHQKGSVAFSPDKEVFAYTGTDKVHILQTNSWSEISSYKYNNSPAQFLIVSPNRDNIMSYHYQGEIEYHDLQNASLLKSANSEQLLHSLMLNNTFRFGVGFNDNTLITIDILNGKIVDEILFTNTIINLYPGYNKDNIAQFTIISKENDDTQSSKLFTLSDAGFIQEDDLFTVSLPKQSSQMISNNNSIYIGFIDGEVWNFQGTPHIQNKNIIIEDNTVAIYDAIYYEEYILISSIDGIFKYPLDTSNNTSNINPRPLNIQNHPLSNPVFIVSPTYDEEPPIKLLSTNTSYENLLPPVNPLNSSINYDKYRLSTEESKPAKLISLLFSIDNNFEIYSPIPLKKGISNIQLNNIYRVAFSSIDSQLYIQTQDADMRVPLLSPRHIYQQGTQSQNEGNVLWTTTVLTDNQLQVPNNRDNMIYSYRVNSEIAPAHPPFSFPFLKNEIFDFQIIETEEYHSFLIASSDYQSSETNFYFTEISSQDEKNKNQTVVYPNYVQPLLKISKYSPLKILPFGLQRSNFIILTEEEIYILSIDLTNKKLGFSYRVAYPPELGILHSAHIQAVKGIESETYILTLVDKNNTVSILKLHNTKNLEILTNFHIHTSNKVNVIKK